MKLMVTLATWLLVLGGIVVGYEAVGGTNLLHTVLGGMPPVMTVVSILIGVSALFIAYTTVTKKI